MVKLKGRNCKLAKARIKREFLAVLMESPIYFIASLQRRLEIPGFFS
jgi:hypothetical protein